MAEATSWTVQSTGEPLFLWLIERIKLTLMGEAVLLLIFTTLLPPSVLFFVNWPKSPQTSEYKCGFNTHWYDKEFPLHFHGRPTKHVSGIQAHLSLTPHSGGMLHFAVLCRRAPWLQNHLSQLLVAEQPAGSPHVAPVTLPPEWPCLYLTVQEGVVIWTTFRNGVVHL